MTSHWLKVNVKLITERQKKNIFNLTREKVIVSVALRFKVDYWHIFSDLLFFLVPPGCSIKAEILIPQ